MLLKPVWDISAYKLQLEYAVTDVGKVMGLWNERCQIAINVSTRSQVERKFMYVSAYIWYHFARNVY